MCPIRPCVCWLVARHSSPGIWNPERLTTEGIDMRYFELRNLMDFILYLFPALAFVVVFGIGLAFTHFIRKDSEKRHKEIIERFAGGIEGKNEFILDFKRDN